MFPPYGFGFFAPFFAPSFFTTTAASLPVDITLAIINAALARHAGHIGFLLAQQSRSPRTRRFCPLPYTFMNMPPALGNSFAVLLLNQSQRRVPKLNQGSVIYFTQAVLHIGDDRIRHEQRPADFQ